MVSIKFSTVVFGRKEQFIPIIRQRRRPAVHKMWPIATDGAHSMVCLCVCLYVGHMDVLCKNSKTVRDADSCGNKEPYIRGSHDLPTGRDNFGGGLSGPMKSTGSHRCSVHSKNGSFNCKLKQAAKGIIQSSKFNQNSLTTCPQMFSFGEHDPKKSNTYICV